MTRRMLIVVLLLANVASFVGGSAPRSATRSYPHAWATDADAQSAIDSLDLDSVQTDTTDALRRDGESGLFQGYAEDTYGYSPEDLKLLTEGALVLPQDDDLGSMNVTEMLSRVTGVNKDLEDETQRDRQSVKTTMEAEAMEQYLDAFHDALENDYKQAKEFSITHLDEYIKFLERYEAKMPAIVYACT